MDSAVCTVSKGLVKYARLVGSISIVYLLSCVYCIVFAHLELFCYCKIRCLTNTVVIIISSSVDEPGSRFPVSAVDIEISITFRYLFLMLLCRLGLTLLSFVLVIIIDLSKSWIVTLYLCPVVQTVEWRLKGHA